MMIKLFKKLTLVFILLSMSSTVSNAASKKINNPTFERLKTELWYESDFLEFKNSEANTNESVNLPEELSVVLDRNPPI